MIDVDVLGLPAVRARADLPDAGGIRDLCRAAAARAGMRDGHLAVEFVDAARIAKLNAEHRGEPRATDVLSFPIDGADVSAGRESVSVDGMAARAREDQAGAAPGGTSDGMAARAREDQAGAAPGGTSDAGTARVRVRAQHPDRELGDVLICLEHTSDVREAIVHGVLHLAGLDHETDDGEMLALQRDVLAAAGALGPA